MNFMEKNAIVKHQLFVHVKLIFYSLYSTKLTTLYCSLRSSRNEEIKYTNSRTKLAVVKLSK